MKERALYRFGLVTGVMSLTMGLLCGCSSFISPPFKDPFLELYTMKAAEVHEDGPKVQSQKLLDLSADGMPFVRFAQWFSDKTGAGVIYSSEADSFKLSAEFRKATPDEVMDGISRRHGLEVVKVGKTYFIGKLAPADRGFLVRRVKGYDATEIQNAITTFLSEFGKVLVQKDGVVVLSDREAVLVRVSRMLDSLEACSGDVWVLQFYVMMVKKDVGIEAGATVTTSGQVAYTLLSKGESPSLDYSNIGQTLDLLFTANSDYVKMRAAPMFLVRDGTEGLWSDGKTVPVPQKTVSDQGTVTTTGFTYIETGLILKAKLREASSGAVLLLDLSDSSIKGYVEGNPIVSKAALKTESLIASGQVYLVGELNRSEDTESVKSVLDISGGGTFTKMQVWVRAYRVKSSLVHVEGQHSPTSNDRLPLDNGREAAGAAAAESAAGAASR